ncbi:MAG: hypothetical protein HS117_18595 [Verrucomicrobiaceae bacterium]|nr:hypothetical protein [Verrucomicrobiaceae bacterium]
MLPKRAFIIMHQADAGECLSREDGLQVIQIAQGAGEMGFDSSDGPGEGQQEKSDAQGLKRGL